MHYRNWDLLRLLAALTVVFIHWQAYCWGMTMRYPLLMDAVPVFVCLSGILIPGSFLTSRSWGHFAWKRVLRVYPAFLASIVFTAVLGGTKTVWPNFLDYFTLGLVQVGTVSNGVLWSLMLEELLYFQLAVNMLRKWWNPYTVTFAMLACSVGWYVGRHDHHADALLRTAAAFFVGNVLYFSLPKWQKVNGWLLLGGFVVVRVFFLYRGSLLGSPGPLIYTLTSSAFLVSGFRNIPQIPKKFPDLSYGMYIYHAPVLYALMPFYKDQPTTFAVRAMAIVVPVCLLSYYLVEKPALEHKNLWWREKEAPVGEPPSSPLEEPELAAATS